MHNSPNLKAFVPALAAGFLLATPVDAQSPWRERAQSRDYDCMAHGQTWRQGSLVCLAGEQRLCGLKQNVASWRATSQSCETPAGEPRKPTN